jgi:hypothetical protein
MQINLNTQEMKAKVAELKLKHGALRLLQHMGHGVILRRASEAEWEAFSAMFAESQKRHGGQRWLVETTAVYPEQEDIKAMFSAVPGLVQNFGTEAMAFNGLDNKDVEKKDL